MATTVIGLFDSFGEAQKAVHDVMRYGVRREDISLLARDEQGTIQHAVGASGAAEGAGAGAVGGSLMGGALGLLVGTGLLVIPGIGPVLAAGPLAAGIGSAAAAIGATAMGAGLGAAAGGLLGGLMGAGVPEGDARAYVEGVRRGGTLVSVTAVEAEAADVREIMLRNGAIDIDRRAASWRDSGWSDAADNAVDVPDAERSADDRRDSTRSRTASGTAAESATGASITSTGAVIGTAAGERAEERRQGPGFGEGALSDVDRKMADPAFTNVDRTGGAVKGSAGFASGHPQPREQRPETFSEFAADGEASIRDTPEGTLPAHGDYARGMREERAAPTEPDYARGMHRGPEEPGQRADEPGMPHHGDYARGMRQEAAEPTQPDYGLGQRGYELYETEFIEHYRGLTGNGGQPFDSYQPAYQFGYAMGEDRAYRHENWQMAEADVRQSWEQEARGNWEEFKQSIRFGWEKARGLR